MTAIPLEGMRATGPAKVWWQGAHVAPAVMGVCSFTWLPSDPYCISVDVMGKFEVQFSIDVALWHDAIADNDGQFHRGAAGSAVGVCSRQDVFGLVCEVEDGAVFVLITPEKPFALDVHVSTMFAQHGDQLHAVVLGELDTLLNAIPGVGSE